MKAENEKDKHSNTTLLSQKFQTNSLICFVDTVWIRFPQTLPSNIVFVIVC